MVKPVATATKRAPGKTIQRGTRTRRGRTKATTVKTQKIPSVDPKLLGDVSGVLEDTVKPGFKADSGHFKLFDDLTKRANKKANERLVLSTLAQAFRTHRKAHPNKWSQTVNELAPLQTGDGGNLLSIFQCPHGANCYRKNRMHIASAHPGAPHHQFGVNAVNPALMDALSK